MKTRPFSLGCNGIAPAGGAAACGGAGRDGAGDGIDGLALGIVGSAGPAPGEATGVPSVCELHPAANAALSIRAASRSRPPVDGVVTLYGNIARPAYAWN